MTEPAPLKIRLNPNGVVAPALRAIRQSTEMVNFSMDWLAKADLSKAPEFEPSRFQFRFAGPDISPEERKIHQTNWVLSKGFQDLARGVRGILEEAYYFVYIGKFLVDNASRKITFGNLQGATQKYRNEAENAKFPELMEAVNKGLISPLHFEKEFLSLQKVRNCLEHRDGVVGERDVDSETKSLKLFLPEMRFYGENDGGLTELRKGSFVEKDSKIIFKNEIREREFKLGERIVFKAEEFHDIGFGCWAFTQDLGSKLPKVTATNNFTENSVLSAPSTEMTSMTDKPRKITKSSRLKARLPRGLADRGPSEIAATRAMVETIRQVYELYGFEPVETPAIEYTDALGKFLPDQDRPNEGVFSFQDDDEQWLSLRYDLTAPLARYVAENFDALPKPYRSYREGWVFRNEKPGPGRFRQFMQFDADTVGSASMAADAEVCMMVADTMEQLGIPRGSYVVKVNNRKVLDGVMEAIGIGGEENAGKRLTVLRAIDKLDRLGADGVRELLGKGRKDESGDFTKGADLDSEQAEEILKLVEAPKIDDEIQATVEIMPTTHEAEMLLREFGYIEEDFDINVSVALKAIIESKFMINSRFRQGAAELLEIAKLAHSSGYELDRIRIDPSVVRGLEYYTGPVYEVELLIETKDEKGRPVRFGSVGGGGRYDGLVSRFRGEPVPATGFSIGVSRLQAALTLIGKLGTQAETGPVVVTVFDRDRIADYQTMVSTLRAANIRAELYLGNPKNNLGVQFKYADKRNSPCAIIQGSDEKAKGEVQIKDLIEGAKAAAAIASNQEWRETRPAQFACKESELVEKVREVLARHGLLHPSP